MDGRVLVAGGYTAYPANANSVSAELYVPATSPAVPVVTRLDFDRSAVVAGTSYAVTIVGDDLTPETYFDIRFTSPGNRISDVI